MGYGGKQAIRSGDIRRFNFTGNGSNTAFDLGFTPATQNQLIVTVNGLVQHYDAFSVTGSTLTFTGTPASGDAIQVTAVVDAVGVAAIPDGAIANVSSLAVSGAATLSNTVAVTGAATFSNNVTINGSNVAVTGQMVFTGTSIDAPIKLQVNNSTQKSVFWLRDTNLVSEYTIDLGASGLVEQWHYDASGWKPKIRFNAGYGVELPQGQLKFPASQNASSDANTLDDYEEGSWSPTAIANGGTGSPNHITQYGRYVKIGRQVTLQCYLVFTKNTMSGGGLAIGGLPFTSAAGQPFNNAMGMWYLPGGSPGYVYVSLYLDAGVTVINTERLFTQGIDSTQNNILISELGPTSNQYLAFMLTYFV